MDYLELSNSINEAFEETDYVSMGFEERLNFVNKFFFNGSSNHLQIYSILFENEDFRKVVADDLSFKCIVKASSSISESSSLVRSLNSSTNSKFLKYPEMKAMLQLSLRAPKISGVFENNTFSFMYYLRSENMQAIQDKNSTYKYYIAASINGEKLLRYQNAPVFRIVKDMVFVDEDSAHRTFIHRWSVLIPEDVQEKVAQWFEINSDTDPTIYAIHEVTRIFEESSSAREAYCELEEMPLEWRKAMEG